MVHSQYSFQHSVLFIDSLTHSLNFIQTGLLACAVQFEFCEGNLDDALKAVEQRKHDILVVTLEFQDGLVLDFAQHLHKKFSHVPSIYMIESHLEALQAPVLKFGALEVFQRPKNASELITHVDHAIVSATQQRELRQRRSHRAES